MGMCVDVVGLAMRCPACVCDAYPSCHILGLAESFKIIDLAARLIDVELVVVRYKGDTRAVISAIFQTVKTLYQNRISLLVSNISYYSTHRDW